MKLKLYDRWDLLVLSLPSWERGLKCFKDLECKDAILSLPSWERGLKYKRLHNYQSVKNVAPLVGAWIEIPNFTSPLSDTVVAPLVGAWIEMFLRLTSPFSFTRRSPRGSVD